jgi:hypothetical protein
MENSQYLPIAITGHRDLLIKDREIIRTAIKELYEQLREEDKTYLKLYSALAPGADIIAAECLEPSDKLVLVQVLPEEIDKAYTFWGKEKSRQPEHEALWEMFQKLKQRPNTQIVDLMSKETLDHSNENIRNQQYIKLAEYLCLNCTHLIALWDGIDGGGVGGTSDVVRMWLKGKGTNGNKLTLPNTKRTLHHLLCPREKNHFPIKRF